MTDDKHILWGRGTTKNIVAVEPLQKMANVVQVYKRENGTLTNETHTYMPFMWVDSKDPNLSEFSGFKSTQLFGGNQLDLLVEDTSMSLLRAINNSCKSYLPFRQGQWLVRTGETLFNGMSFDDPLRLYVDIETYTNPKYDFPNSSREEDKITMISLLTNRGGKRVMVLNDDGKSPQMENVTLYNSEKEMLEAFVLGIRKLDPDVLTGHNIFGFDLPYIRDRMTRYGVKFAIGRDGSEPYSFTTSVKFAEKSDQYENFSVFGRHVTDTYFFAKKFDSVARCLDSYNLKYCANFLRGEDDSRTYIDGDEIGSVWDGSHESLKREDLIRYALDDVIETQILDRSWGRASFEMTKMIPLPMQDVARYGTGNLIDMIFTRYYLENLWSWPIPDPERKFKGGYANTFIYGYVNEPLVYVDVGSLYPSLAQMLKIQPRKDELYLFQKMVKLLKAERYVYKRQSNDKSLSDVERSDAKAIDSTLKTLLNTGSYGWLGYSFGAFNDYDEAERITEWGQKVIKNVNEQARSLGGKVLRTDTDGSLVTVPERYRGEENELLYIKTIEDKLNEWLRTQKF